MFLKRSPWNFVLNSKGVFVCRGGGGRLHGFFCSKGFCPLSYALGDWGGGGKSCPVGVCTYTHMFIHEL